VVAKPGRPAKFHALAYDAHGNPLGEARGVWGLETLAGTVDSSGTLVSDPERGAQAGRVTFTSGELRSGARVRVFPDLPWREDFETLPDGANPPYWVGAGNRFVVRPMNGNRVLSKPFKNKGLERQNLYIGPPDLQGYTIQADLMGTRKGRRRPDMGLIAGGYTLDLMGNHQRLQIRDWAELRLEKHVDFSWEPDVWYTMKMRVDVARGEASIQGKVWRTGTPEPAAWTISVNDPVPIPQGSPGLYGYSPTEILYDNVTVTVSE
jgi:hypothetical protein